MLFLQGVKVSYLHKLAGSFSPAVFHLLRNEREGNGEALRCVKLQRQQQKLRCLHLVRIFVIAIVIAVLAVVEVGLRSREECEAKVKVNV